MGTVPRAKSGHVCTGAAGLEMVGYGWHRAGVGYAWSRYLLRRCRECGSLEVQLVHWVEGGYRVCLSCLGQRMRVDVAAGVARCLSCGSVTEEG